MREIGTWLEGRRCFHCNAELNHEGPNKKFYCDPCNQVVKKRRRRAAYLTLKSRKAGDLPDPSLCSCHYCGSPASQYDHRDYAFPLGVKPTCRSCNVSIGPATISGFTADAEIKGSGLVEDFTYAVSLWSKRGAVPPGRADQVRRLKKERGNG